MVVYFVFCFYFQRKLSSKNGKSVFLKFSKKDGNSFKKGENK